MATYSTNSDLTLLNGISIDDPQLGFFISGLSQAEKDTLMESARTKAYNFINDKLRGKTAIPATHIPALKEIEIDLVFSYLIRDSHVQETLNQSEWQPKYEDAIKALENMQFDSSANVPEAGSENTGNGTMTVHSLNEEFTKTEIWLFTANSNNQFSVNGTKTGALPTLTIDIRYPENDWADWVKFPFYVTINSGSIDFAADDKFILETYASRFKIVKIEKMVRA